MTTKLDEDLLDESTDFREEYGRYLTCLEHGYDICLSIDFITDRILLAQV